MKYSMHKAIAHVYLYLWCAGIRRIEGLLALRASSDAVLKIASDPGGIRKSSHPVRSLVSMPTGLHWLLMTTKYYSKIWGPLLIVRVLPGNTFIPNVILAKFAIDFTKHCLLCLSRLSLRLSVNLLRVPEMVGVFSENYRKILLICDDTFFFLKSDKR